MTMTVVATAKPHVAKAYGVVKVKRAQYGATMANGQRRVTSVVLTRVLQNKPTLAPDEVVVEIALVFPPGYFDQTTPVVTANITSQAQTPVTANATVPADPQYTPDARPTRGLSPSAAASIIHPYQAAGG